MLEYLNAPLSDQFSSVLLTEQPVNTLSLRSYFIVGIEIAFVDYQEAYVSNRRQENVKTRKRN